jgi:hypothetical protein
LHLPELRLKLGVGLVRLRDGVLGGGRLALEALLFASLEVQELIFAPVALLREGPLRQARLCGITGDDLG